MEVIQELAEQLGVAVDNLLSVYAPYYLGQTLGAAALALILFVIAIIACIVLLYLGSKVDDIEFAELIFIFALVAGIICLCSLFALCTTIPSAVGAIMSPQGAAVADIISKVRGVV